jgi:EAL domain-containing protein (putative c-di-GMP-specific phosphodiesterase class I)
VSFLKLEGTLVRRASSEPRVQAILRGIQDIAGELGLTTVAEMVEDQETADLMRAIGVDRAQGFHFARPALAEETPETERGA